MADLSPEAKAAVEAYVDAHRAELRKSIVGRSWADVVAPFALFILLGATGLIGYLAVTGKQLSLDRGMAFVDPADTAAVPPGAVLAFDHRDGCPKEGWEPFTPAAGRMIVGVGKRVGVPGEFALLYNDKGPLYEVGGQEAVALTYRHLPANLRYARDDVPWASVDNNDWSNRYASAPRQTAQSCDDAGKEGWRVGSGDPVPVMPPWIALYVCKKL